MFKFIGRGGHGRVYQSKENEVTKVGDIGPNEVSCQREAAEMGLSPDVLDHSDNSITMRKVKGQTVYSKGSMTPQQYQKLVEKVGKAHAARLFHNDLVAANVMITEDDDIQIIDWGRGSTNWPDPECRDDEDQLEQIQRRYVK